ncbi:hypothetical protein FHX34_10136 [Actinoplanes teichomyceticus]|uniref:Uncharacterized protein n=1 Tax=Actinoplanes teichomyceticus TaxID=1867 RepID=A0A561WMG8_ACTTI|nr:hypothetical protein FHX34_10136 [Actinoplanes teichomyceticus]
MGAQDHLCGGGAPGPGDPGGWCGQAA